MKRILSVLLYLVIVPITLFSYDLHAILVINTDDDGIGCINDYNNWQSELSRIEDYTGLNIIQYVLKDNDWDSETVIQTCQDLRVDSEDVVLFYYSGHGLRLWETEDIWPVMALQDDVGLELTWVHETLKAKNPRFLLTMADCCNSYLSWYDVVTPNQRAHSISGDQHYKELFLEYKGDIISSGCIPGQYSYGGSSGGAYTNQFFEALHDNSNTQWDSLMTATVSPIYDGEQTPQQETNITPWDGSSSNVASSDSEEEYYAEEYNEDEYYGEDYFEDGNYAEDYYEGLEIKYEFLFSFQDNLGSVGQTTEGIWVGEYPLKNQTVYYEEYDADNDYYYIMDSSNIIDNGYYYSIAVPKNGGLVYEYDGDEWIESLYIISGAVK